MSTNNNKQKPTTKDAVHIGLATKDLEVYFFASLAIETIKLPFTMLAAVGRHIFLPKKQPLQLLTAKAKPYRLVRKNPNFKPAR